MYLNTLILATVLYIYEVLYILATYNPETNERAIWRI